MFPLFPLFVYRMVENMEIGFGLLEKVLDLRPGMLKDEFTN